MRPTFGLLFKLSLFLIAVFSAYTQFTDADLFDQEDVHNNRFEATTLDFSTNDTANELSKSLLFSVTGMIPSGFQVETVRIKNSGKLEFPYSVSVQKTAGSDTFCQSLEGVIMQDWSPVYSGNLMNLSFSGELSDQEKWEDLVFVVKFNNKDVALKNQTCAFNISFVSQSPESHFTDTETLQNTVTSGAWAE
jgi:hypothetical protein